MQDSGDYIPSLRSLGYPYVLFTYDEVDDPNAVVLDHSVWEENEDGNVSPLLTEYYKGGYKRSFEEAIDFVDWINARFDGA